MHADSETDAMKLQPSDCQRNPACIHFGPTDHENSPAALLSDNCNENPAYNIIAQPSAPQEPTYEVIPSDTDRIPRGGQDVNCSQNPAYIHLGVHVEESFQAATAPMSPCDYSQNPAYGIHSNPK
jgi:protein-arginine kinase activator protein McsA